LHEQADAQRGRRIGDGRALLVTPTGQSALRELLEIEDLYQL
jgi:hypothetical protein